MLRHAKEALVHGLARIELVPDAQQALVADRFELAAVRAVEALAHGELLVTALLLGEPRARRLEPPLQHRVRHAVRRGQHERDGFLPDLGAIAVVVLSAGHACSDKGLSNSTRIKA